MHAEASSSQITVQPLPQLPHPDTLASPAGPAVFLVQELQSAYAQLAQLRQSVYANPTSYALDPPGPSSLPPLPPIPLPPTSTRRSSSRASQSNTPKPIARPPIHPSSSFANANTIDECVQAVRRAGYGAESRYGSSAIWVDMKTMRAWITLRTQSDIDGSDMAVRNVRVYAGSEGERPIHAQSTSQPHRALSRHLSDLQLNLPELLYRLIALPKVMSSPCHFCGTHMKAPDGLPTGNTGYLEAAKPTNAGETGEEENGTGDRADDGRWVIWHSSCEPVS